MHIARQRAAKSTLTSSLKGSRQCGYASGLVDWRGCLCLTRPGRCQFRRLCSRQLARRQRACRPSPALRERAMSCNGRPGKSEGALLPTLELEHTPTSAAQRPARQARTRNPPSLSWCARPYIALATLSSRSIPPPPGNRSLRGHRPAARSRGAPDSRDPAIPRRAWGGGPPRLGPPAAGPHLPGAGEMRAARGRVGGRAGRCGGGAAGRRGPAALWGAQRLRRASVGYAVVPSSAWYPCSSWKQPCRSYHLISQAGWNRYNLLYSSLLCTLWYIWNSNHILGAHACFLVSCLLVLARLRREPLLPCLGLCSRLYQLIGLSFFVLMHIVSSFGICQGMSWQHLNQP